MVAYIFVILGVVRECVALTIVYLDILLYCAGGMHRNDASCLFLRHACSPYGARCVFLGGRSDSANDPDAGVLELSPAGSEVQRFHQGMSLSILVLAALLLIFEMIRYQTLTDLLVLSGCFSMVAVLATRLSAAYFARQIGR